MMKRILIRSLTFSVLAAGVWAGGLTLQVGAPDANSEAKLLHAVLVAEVTACQEPAKSMVTASVVQVSHGEMRRAQLRTTPLKTPGMFAVIGEVPPGSVVDLAVANPDYKNYEPRVLLRAGAQGLEWGSIRRFYSKAPTDAEVKAFLGAGVD